MRNWLCSHEGCTTVSKDNSVTELSFAWGMFFLSLTAFGVNCFLFPDPVNIQNYSSGIFDADVARVVSNITSFQSDAHRIRVHPLFQIFLTPLSLSIQKFILIPVTTARVVCILGILIQVVLVMLTAWTCLPKSSWIAPLAGGLFLSTFSVNLFGVIPEACAWSGVSSLLPIWFMFIRRGKRFSLLELIGWALILPISIGFTITQIVFWFLGIAFRILCSIAERNSIATMRVCLGCFFSAILGAALVAGLAEYQHVLNPGALPFYAVDFISEETHYSHLGFSAFTSEHLLSVMSQMFVYPFAPPKLAYSDFIVKLGYFYYSLSFHDSTLAVTSARQFFFMFLLTFALYVMAVRSRFLGYCFFFLLAGVLSQIVLHIFYGREFILYSLNWVGLFSVCIALLLGGVLNSRERRLWIIGLCIFFIPLAVFNNYQILNEVMMNVQYGLETQMRDASGLPLKPMPEFKSLRLHQITDKKFVLTWQKGSILN